jgi:hypothetical protein
MAASWSLTKTPVSGTSLIIASPPRFASTPAMWITNPVSSSQHSGGISKTESIRVFTKSIGMPVAVRDNIKDRFERPNREIAWP